MEVEKSKIPSLSADPDKGQNSFRSELKDVAGSSLKNELPHWLREAVGGPAKPESGLPPNISAIAQSVRILYGDDNPAIPPFLSPGLPPAQPKDPRKKLKKKRRRERAQPQAFNEHSLDIAGTSHGSRSSLHAEKISSASPPLVKSSHPCVPQLSAATLGLPNEPNPDTPPPSVNVPNPSSASVDSHAQKKQKTEMTTSPEAPQLVTCIVTSDPPESSLKSPASNIFLPESAAQVIVPVPEDAGKESKDKNYSSAGMLSPHTEEKAEQTESRDSSKTHSDPIQPEADGTSSEGTVSDHRGSEQEP